jgi:hypothetical protein
MKKPALRRARKTTLLFVTAALLFLAGLAGTTLGYFDGETDNVATWSGGFVFPPTNATTLGGPVGAGQTITWTTPTTTGVQNYVLRVTNMGTSAVACPAQNVVTTTVTMPTTTQAGTVTWPVTYPETVATLAAPAGSGVATIPSTDNGQFVCYQVAADWTPATWYSKNANANATAVRAGLWPTAVAKANHATTGSLAATDTITITYNQNVSVTTSPVSVCAVPGTSGSGVVIVGDTSGCASASDAYSIGKITGLTIGGVSRINYSNSTVTAGTTAVTVTLAGSASTATASGTGTWVSGTGNVKSANSPVIGTCTASNCNTIAPSGGF